ncbi:hypothetical protein V6K52_18630 [Knoellia sp. S7-12]|uniref:hypothetical protein n=1 Tax=Knoellia sp. S7-12 TaxID=3126698 RepID=UPI003368D24F
MSVVLHRALPLVAAMALVAPLSACGGSDAPAKPGATASASTVAKKKPTASALYQQSRDSALAAKSGHVKGSFTEDGESTAIDIAGSVDGANQQATISTPQGEVTMLTVGGKFWIKGDRKYWTESIDADAAKAIGAKWLVVPPAEVKDMGDTTIKNLLTEMYADASMSKLESVATAVNESTVAGVPAYVLTDKIGGNGEIFMTADGKAQLIKLVGPKDEPGELAFTEWNAVKPFAAPAAAQIFTP